ncbi:STAS domain-containing protein, partial [Streptomyces sp. URMC 126]
MNETLHLTTQHTRGSLAVAALAGALDIHTAPELRTGALELIGQGHRHLILDLGAVTFCDSSGFNALVG